MALLERVATLLRANLNDLIDRAEHPEKMLKQVILDMENQLMQVKTQVAIAIADHHLLMGKRDENLAKEQEFMKKAELALDKRQEDLARAALERALSFQQMAASFEQQVADQNVQVENLKSALGKLDQKLIEARTKAEMLAAEHRRARAVSKANGAHMAITDASNSGAFERMRDKVQRASAAGRAGTEMLEENKDDRLETLQKDDQVDRLLAELKARKGLAK
ncbi:MAG: phage shock protein PspA [Bryobacterales bacterium]|nr:phage shock protein PspA [Bryobacterales bacterium]